MKRRSGVVFVFGTHEAVRSCRAAQLECADEPFRLVLERSDGAVREHLGLSVLEALPGEGAADELLPEFLAVPALTTLQLGLVAAWRARGIEPAAVVGNCVGELAAASAAGALDWRDAISMSCCIARSMRTGAGRGCMLDAEVGGSQASSLRAAAPRPLHLAVAVDEDRSIFTCAAGDLEVLRRFFDSREVAVRILDTGFGLHSPLTDGWREDLYEVARRCRIRVGQAAVGSVPILSCHTGGRIDPHRLHPDHWWGVIRAPQRRPDQPIVDLLESGFERFVEINAHPNRTARIEQLAGRLGRPVLVAPSMRRGERAAATLEESLERLAAAETRTPL